MHDRAPAVTTTRLTDPTFDPAAPGPRLARPAWGAGTDAPLTIALSGPDNTGKTTQLRVLARRLTARHATLTGPLEDFDPRWTVVRSQGMSRWWFQDAPVHEVADVLACSYLARSRTPVATSLRLVDRGVMMLEASLAATVGVRENLDVRRAADRAVALLKPYAEDLRRAQAGEHGIVLLHDVDAAAGTVRSLARERAVSSRYAAYQRQLHDHVHRLIERDRHTAVVVGDRSVLAVQDELRALLAGGHPVLPDGALRDVQLVALGGLSESGKSTAGEYLRTRHAYARLKIGWLIRTAADLADLADPYACTPQVQAELLVDALDRYCAAHPYLDRVTIESLHRFEATAELRRLLGKQLTVLYLDAHADVRAARGTAGPGDVAERDIVKSERGAARVADLADEVIDNNRSSVALRHRLDQIALAARWPLRRPVPIAVGELGLPVRLAAYLTALLDQVTGEPAAVDLLAVTGSGARRTYRDGWSDLDVFVVAEPAGLPRLRQALDDLRDGLGGVKLGVTAVTAAECRSAAITPRLLHVLTLLGDGDYAPLWCRPGLSLPAPSPADDAAASAADAASAAIEIRRQLLHGAPDLRKLYKTTALLAKLILRILGTSQREHENDDSALVALLHDEPQNGPHDADPGQWAQRQRQARTDRATATTMATLVLDRWLSTFPQAGRS